MGLISIHAPRMGSDQHVLEGVVHHAFISIHAPRMGSDILARSHRLTIRYFNPRSPGGERPGSAPERLRELQISIHAPRVGSDKTGDFAEYGPQTFQSTLPGWGATTSGTLNGTVTLFQSTLPGWGATKETAEALGMSQFQSTLPGWGATVRGDRGRVPDCHFNPRSPGGERLHVIRRTHDLLLISIHAPRVGSDTHRQRLTTTTIRFQSTLPGWGATCRPARKRSPRLYFNPRSPGGERRSMRR